MRPNPQLSFKTSGGGVQPRVEGGCSCRGSGGGVFLPGVGGGSSQGSGRVALEGKGPQRQPQQRLDGRLEEVVKAVWGGYCRLRMPLRLVLGVGGTAAGHRLGALEGGGGGTSPPSNASLGSGGHRARGEGGGVRVRVTELVEPVLVL